MNTYAPHIQRWLLCCCFMVALMLVIGGITRLTHSGLSMVNWQPVTGWLPPLTEQAWEENFSAYKETPEFIELNFDMELEGYKSIFFWEYLHRVLGRITGLVFIVPFIYFMWKKHIPRPLIAASAGCCILVGLQGVIGWYMVKSGLVKEPDVSHFRLTLHLLTAFLLFGCTYWTALRASNLSGFPGKYRNIAFVSMVLTALLTIQIAFGGFLAGLNGGLVYNSFPLMNNQWIPDGFWFLEPWYLNLLENIDTIQFIHRWVAMLIGAIVCITWVLSVSFSLDKSVRVALHSCFVLTIFQIILGVATLVQSVPIMLASLHQFGALALFASFLTLNYLCIGKNSTCNEAKVLAS